MTHPKNESNAIEDAMELLTQHGTEELAEVFRILLNHTMKDERSEALSAQPYERTRDRRGYANGFKPKSLDTRLGKIEFAREQQHHVDRLRQQDRVLSAELANLEVRLECSLAELAALEAEDPRP